MESWLHFCESKTLRSVSFCRIAKRKERNLGRALANKLAALAVRGQGRRSGMLVGEINGRPAREHLVAPMFVEAGFRDTAQGFQMRRVAPVASLPVPAEHEEHDGEESDQSESA